MENETCRKIRERMLKAFMDVIILAILTKESPMSGYDLIRFINNRFHILLSSGTVYSALYSMERNRLISGMLRRRKKVYKLTHKGENTLKAISKANQKILEFMRTIFEISG